jgi:cyclopropane-fatty-acyl-phospholipid synthase
MDTQAHFLQSGRRAAPWLTRWLYDRVNALLAPAGVVLDGGRPWDPQIHHPRALSRLLLHGTLGAGDAYVDGEWDCRALDDFTARLLTAGADRGLTPRSPLALIGQLVAPLVNHQTRNRAKANVTSHYDIGVDLYEAMLGRRMAYSCGYWANATTVDEAQDAKHALVCRKLHLAPGMQVLDVGCGWGGFAKYAAEHHGVRVVGITISGSQAAYAAHSCAGLPVEILEADYRDLSGTFDRIVSIGMFEHVGPPNYRQFFETMRRVLAPDGLLLLHTIGGNLSQETSDPWIARYIFPGSVLPSAAQVSCAIEGLFLLEDWHNFGVDYDRTLMAWHAGFEQAWPQLSRQYSERFYRLWRYYLLTCAGTFRARRNQLWQIVLSPRGVIGGYDRIAH